MERSETRDDSWHVIDITTKSSPSTFNVSDIASDARDKPLSMNSGCVITFEFVMTMSQIIAAIVVLYNSKHEHGHRCLFACIISYACGCVATLPLLFWRFYYRNDSPPNNATTRRLKAFEIGLNCFFIAWIVYAGLCIFAGDSVSGADNLYRLLIVFEFCMSIRFGMQLFLQWLNSVLGYQKHNLIEVIEGCVDAVCSMCEVVELKEST